ncbi:MAG: hypothetical protein ACI9DQ_001140, partial [Glaciecola sp.]
TIGLLLGPIGPKEADPIISVQPCDDFAGESIQNNRYIKG